MAEFRTADQWRAQFRLDRDQAADSAILVRVPASIREYLDQVIAEKGGSLSELVRLAVADWVLGESTPNLAARRKWLEGLAAIHSSCETDPEGDEQWVDDNPSETARLAGIVRRTDAEWAKLDQQALRERDRRIARALADEAQDLQLLREWRAGAGGGKTFEQFLQEKGEA